MRANRIPPQIMRDKSVAALQRGESRHWVQSESRKLTVWRDCKLVCMLDTFVSPDLAHDTAVRRAGHLKIPVPRPHCFSVYNETMGAIDIVDQVSYQWCESWSLRLGFAASCILRNQAEARQAKLARPFYTLPGTHGSQLACHVGDEAPCQDRRQAPFLQRPAGIQNAVGVPALRRSRNEVWCTVPHE